MPSRGERAANHDRGFVGQCHRELQAWIHVATIAQTICRRNRCVPYLDQARSPFDRGRRQKDGRQGGGQTGRDYDLRSNWEGDVLHFDRSGLHGTLAVTAKDIQVDVKLVC